MSKKLWHFYLPQCSACAELEPIIQRVLRDHYEISYERVHLAQDPRAKQFEIRKIPTLIYLEDDAVKGRLSGLTDYAHVLTMMGLTQ